MCPLYEFGLRPLVSIRRSSVYSATTIHEITRKNHEVEPGLCVFVLFRGSSPDLPEEASHYRIEANRSIKLPSSGER